MHDQSGIGVTGLRHALGGLYTGELIQSPRILPAAHKLTNSRSSGYEMMQVHGRRQLALDLDLARAPTRVLSRGDPSYRVIPKHGRTRGERGTNPDLSQDSMKKGNVQERGALPDLARAP